VLLTTPEWRLSLLLKRQELWEQGKEGLCSSLDAQISLPFVDLLDESDVLLSHKCVCPQSLSRISSCKPEPRGCSNKVLDRGQV
jgi:hypothetical protein